MGGPAWLTGTFAALMLTVACYCAGRLAVARRWRRPTALDTDAGHVLMGVAMAGMLVARLHILPAAAWETVFAAGAAWFAWRLLRSRRAAASSWRCPHPAPHLVECAAMLYMLFLLPPLASRAATAAPGTAGMAAMAAAGSRFSALALVVALFMIGYVVRVVDHLPLRVPVTPAPVLTPAAVLVPMATSAPMVTSASASTPALDGTVSAGARPYLAPRCAALCKIAMGLTMAYTLVLML